MFFSLSIGMGAMITYGSYLDKKENLQKNAILIIVMDTLVALMAGLCVMPARFALDPEGPIGGPKLLFVTMQNVFSRMGGAGPIFGILFYLLVVFAAISSSISLLEVIVAHFVDRPGTPARATSARSTPSSPPLPFPQAVFWSARTRWAPRASHRRICWVSRNLRHGPLTGWTSGTASRRAL